MLNNGCNLCRERTMEVMMMIKMELLMLGLLIAAAVVKAGRCACCVIVFPIWQCLYYKSYLISPHLN